MNVGYEYLLLLLLLLLYELSCTRCHELFSGDLTLSRMLIRAGAGD